MRESPERQDLAGNLEDLACRASAPPGTSWCGHCQQYVPIQDFNLSKRHETGIEVTCRKCTREMDNLRYREQRRTGRRGRPPNDSPVQTQIRRVPPEGFGWCRLCKDYLPVAQFHVCRARKCGLSWVCRECTRRYGKQRWAHRAKPDRKGRRKLMSHVTSLKIPTESGVGDKIVDLELLQLAAERLGGIFMRGQQTYRWFGRFRNDFKLPEWLTPEQVGHCEHAIRFENCEFEIGLVQHDGGWVPLFDFWDRGLSEKIGGKSASKLLDVYVGAFKQKKAVEALKAVARAKGLPVATSQAGNVVKITIRLPG